MAVNDNISSPILSDEQGGTLKSDPSSMTGVRPWRNAGFNSIKVQFGHGPVIAKGLEGRLPDSDKHFPGRTDLDLEGRPPDLSDAYVFDSKQFHPVPDSIASRLSVPGNSRNVWMVGQAPGLLPGTLVVRNTQSPTDPDNNDQYDQKNQNDKNTFDKNSSRLDAAASPKNSSQLTVAAKNDGLGNNANVSIKSISAPKFSV